jgi:hypothetical protein
MQPTARLTSARPEQSEEVPLGYELPAEGNQVLMQVSELCFDAVRND